MPRTMEVDIPALCSVVHDCDMRCVNPKRCCACYEITVSRRELRNIVDYIPEAAEFCPALKSNGDFNNIFEPEGGSLYSLDTHDDGTCVLAYRKGRKVLCSLHTIAIKRNITIGDIKPMHCLLWPLAITDGKKSVLTIQDDAFDFACNQRAPDNEFSLCPSIAQNIEWAFGSTARRKIQAAVDKKQKSVRITV